MAQHQPHYFNERTKVIVVLGAQWGDEGKGKIIDLLASEADYVGRYNGGANAGHTIVANGVKYAFHLIPSGILYDSVINVIGNGVVLHIPSLIKELENLDNHKINWKGRLLISDRAHLLFDFHKLVDGLNETQLGDKKIGTTKQGIGPCYTGKMARVNLRVGELRNFDDFESKFRKLVKLTQQQYGNFEYDVESEVTKYKELAKVVEPLIVDTVPLVYNSLKKDKKWLIESANATMLDIDFGTYPFVTSSSPSIGGACTGLGIPACKLNQVIAIVKAYCTRVGEGPFPTELKDETGEHLRKVGFEFGTTTGRPRRCGWLDLVQVKYAHMINNFTHVALTKLDVLTGLTEIKVAVGYTLDGKDVEGFPAELSNLARVEVKYETLPGFKEDITQLKKYDELPQAAKKYVEFIEKFLEIPVRWIGVGPGREATVEK